MKLALTLGCIAMLTGCSATVDLAYAERKATAYAVDIDKALAGKTAGKPQTCISLRDANGTEQVGDRTILYTVNKRLIYRNDPRGGCPSLGRDRTLVTRVYSSQLCRGDIVTPTDLVSGFSGGSCSLGDFVPYRSN